MKPPRDPARLEPLLDLLYEAWSKCPDLRLSQLIVNAIASPIPCPQIFYAEDEVVERGLRKMLEEMKVQHGS